MKKIVLSGFFFTFYFNANSQSIERQILASAGNYIEVGNKSYSYTVGEVAIETFSSATIVLTQGFHQPDSSGGGGVEIFEVEIYFFN